jgi:hypothetical protein
MWFPWFNRLLREFRRTQEAIAEHEHAARDRSAASDQEQNEAGRAIAGAIQAAANTIPAYKYTKSDKEYALQRTMLKAIIAGVVGAWVAAAGAFWYAHIAHHQACIMQQTYTEIQAQTKDADDTLAQVKQQTAMLQQQMEGTVAAILDPRVSVAVQVPGTVNLVIYNAGDATVQDFQGKITVTPVTVPGGAPIKDIRPMIVPVDPTVVPPSTHPPVLQQPTQRILDLTISADEMRDFQNRRYGFEAYGTFSYHNGIDRDAKYVSTCVVYFQDPEIPANIDAATCDNLALEFRNAQIRTEEDEKRKQQQK